MSPLWLITITLLSLIIPQPRHQLSLAFEPYRDQFGRPLLQQVISAAFPSICISLAVVVFVIFLTFLLTPLFYSLTQNKTHWGHVLQQTQSSALKILIAMPGILFVMALQLIYGAGFSTLLAGITLSLLPSSFRFFDSLTKTLAQQDFVTASYAFGSTSVLTWYRHIFPHLLPYFLIKIPQFFTQALLTESGLSFLGIGVPRGNETWGTLLLQAKDYCVEIPSMMILYGLPLILTLMSLQLLTSYKPTKNKHVPL